MKHPGKHRRKRWLWGSSPRRACPAGPCGLCHRCPAPAWQQLQSPTFLPPQRSELSFPAACSWWLGGRAQPRGESTPKHSDHGGAVGFSPKVGAVKERRTNPAAPRTQAVTLHPLPCTAPRSPAPGAAGRGLLAEDQRAVPRGSPAAECELASLPARPAAPPPRSGRHFPAAPQRGVPGPAAPSRAGQRRRGRAASQPSAGSQPGSGGRFPREASTAATDRRFQLRGGSGRGSRERRNPGTPGTVGAAGGIPQPHRVRGSLLDLISLEPLQGKAKAPPALCPRAWLGVRQHRTALPPQPQLPATRRGSQPFPRLGGTGASGRGEGRAKINFLRRKAALPCCCGEGDPARRRSSAPRGAPKARTCRRAALRTGRAGEQGPALSPAPASPLLLAFLCSPSWAQQLLLFLRMHMARPCWASRLPAPPALSGPASAALRPEGGEKGGVRWRNAADEGSVSSSFSSSPRAGGLSAAVQLGREKGTGEEGAGGAVPARGGGGSARRLVPSLSSPSGQPPCASGAERLESPRPARSATLKHGFGGDRYRELLGAQGGRSVGRSGRGWPWSTDTAPPSRSPRGAGAGPGAPPPHSHQCAAFLMASRSHP